jgi:hypothetical protein
VSLWARVFRKASKEGEAAPGGRGREDRGDLEGALAEYEREALFEEALRVALVMVDAEADPGARVRLLARALRLAAQAGEVPLSLKARYARARLDVLRAAGSPPVWELNAVGKELEQLEEHAAAAEAYRLAGDRQAEARMLVAGGDIEQLEGILENENERVRVKRQRSKTLADFSALEGSGQRLAALDAARVFLAAHPSDDELKGLVGALSSRLCKPPTVKLWSSSGEARWVLGAEAVLGRVDCAVSIGSPVVSRRHLRFWRGAGGEPMVEDLSTRNGTFLAGARLGAPLPVRSPLSLSIGGELVCVASPAPGGGLLLEVAGEQWRLALADEIGLLSWRLCVGPGAVRLAVPPGGAAPILNDGVAAGEGVDLCEGDVILEQRGGASVLRVLG